MDTIAVRVESCRLEQTFAALRQNGIALVGVRFLPDDGAVLHLRTALEASDVCALLGVTARP